MTGPGAVEADVPAIVAAAEAIQNSTNLFLEAVATTTPEMTVVEPAGVDPASVDAAATFGAMGALHAAAAVAAGGKGTALAGVTREIATQMQEEDIRTAALVVSGGQG